MSVPKMLWWLPRPRSTQEAAGGFPKYFERQLFGLYGWPPLILQPFGGSAEYGVRVDVRRECKPEIIADATQLPFGAECFDFVLLDPPYSDAESRELFGTGPVNRRAALLEAVRVCRIGGLIAWYDVRLPPFPKARDGWYCVYDRLIGVVTRVEHRLRLVTVFRKTRRLL